jgi:cytochrome c-type biogenesis protein CcmH/NrfG
MLNVSSKRLVKQDPECVKAHYRMGQAWFALKEYRKARSCYEIALRLEPTLSNAKKAIAECTKLARVDELKGREQWKGLFG